MKTQTPNRLRVLAVCFGLVLTLVCQNAIGQIQIRLMGGQVRCLENTINLGHVTQITADRRDLVRLISQLDIDSFEDGQSQVVISKEQIRIRLALAGVRSNEFELVGSDQVIAISTSQTNIQSVIENALAKQLAERFVMPIADLHVSLDPRFKNNQKPAYDYSNLRINQNFTTDIPLGRQTIAVTVPELEGESGSLMIPVSVAIVRELVVAKKNIARNQLIQADQIETVRRPVTSRNIRFASFEQVVGASVQSDIQQYDIIRSNAVRTASADKSFLIKKNTRVNIVARRGALTVVLKDAKALENGNRGDRISLLNPKSNERVLARVIDSSTVEIKY